MEDNRKSPRCSIHWRCAIVIENHGKQETMQTRTNDISMTGVSVICHRNIPPPKPVTVYLLIDPGDENHPQVIAEAQGEIKNNVLSGQQGGFRLGIQFTKFARDGKQILEKNLPRELVRSAKMVATPDMPSPRTMSTPAPATPAPAAETPPAPEETSVPETSPATEGDTPPDNPAASEDASAAGDKPEQA
ncbi:MAG: PilZ domain-containing protein [Betaproteobacteria bacterium]|nr:PilZ domain-containing protein [Betaproteobacteria bacterium]